MSVTVDVAAAVTDLTILATVKTEMNISGSSDDTVLEAFISQASDFIRKYTNRLYERQTITETLPGTGHVSLYLSRTPIVSLTSVTVNNALSVSDTYTLENGAIGQIISHDDSDNPAAKVWPLSSRPQSGLSQHIQYGSFANNITIVYVSGFLLPGEGGRNLPEDLERACIELVKMFFERRTSDPSIKFEKIGDSAQALDIDKELPLTIRMILDRWSRVPVTL